jgi:hypothetical protein
VLLGVAATWINRDLPVVRNSLLYARISEHLVTRDMRFWEVCDQPDLVKDKACGFAVLAAPLTAMLGTNTGLKWASCVGGVLFLLSLYVFFRRFNRHFGLGDAHLDLELVIAAWNPLVIYQFWSAYPDGAFFAVFVAAFVVLDRLLDEEEVGGGGGLALAYLALFLLGLFLKPWMLVSFPLHAAFVWYHRDAVARLWRTGDTRLLWLGAAVIGVVVFVAAAWLGMNPLLNLQSNADQYDAPVAYVKSVKQFLWFAAITFGPLLLLALPRVRVTAQDAIVGVLAVLYAHVFMVYSGATYNARYYVPLVAFVSPYLARAVATRLGPGTRRTLMAVFIVINLTGILVTNTRQAFTAFDHCFPGRFRAFGYRENLRMAAHLQAAHALAQVNAQLPAYAKLYYISSYYDGASHQVYEAMGLFRADIRIVYALEPPRAEQVDDGAYVFVEWSEVPVAWRAGYVALGYNLYRVYRGPSAG